MRRSTRTSSDAFAAMTVTLKAIQASTDALPPLKPVVSAVIMVLELTERQTKDFSFALPSEVQKSVVESERLFKKTQKFLQAVRKENIWERFARQDRNKSKVEEYARLLDEAILDFSILELSIHQLHVEFAAAERERHAAVLTVSRMSESERLQLLTQIHGNVRVGKHAVMGCFFF
ncbi:hypothetical protein K438DRAFT_1992097 [Mycena galopus ATCC 62051]|nr:hypothetical protein K438DRAFT_1992097 [Mycena galopus ATCC 62051]